MHTPGFERHRVGSHKFAQVARSYWLEVDYSLARPV